MTSPTLIGNHFSTDRAFLPDGRIVLVLTKGDRLPLRDEQNAAAAMRCLHLGLGAYFI